MCMNCGCMKPDDDQGDDRNITMDDLRRAADANGQSVDQTVETIERTYRMASRQDTGGSSVQA